MASFNVKPDPQAAPNYTGASQGISASPNTALGSLFEGLAGAADMGIKEADRSTQETIRNEIYDSVDGIQDEFGTSSATLFQEDEDSPAATPPMLNDAGRHLSGLQAQYEKGGLKESHYWARMNSMVRQLRGRYPGYRAEIDSMVSGIVGARPANALRSSLFNEWESAAASASDSTKAYNSLTEWALKAPPSVTGRTYLPSDFLQRQEGGNPYSMTELQAHIQEVQTEEGVITRTRTNMALDIEKENFQTIRAEKAFATEATSFVNGVLGDVNNSLGKSFQDVQAQVAAAQTAAASGNPLDAETLNQLPAQIAQLQQGIAMALNAKFTESWDGDPSHAYAAHLDNEQRSAIIATAMAPIALLNDSILNKDYGMVSSVSAYLTAQKTQDQREILADIPFLGTLQSLKDVAGPEALGFYLNLNPEFQTAMTKVLVDYHHTQGALGSGSVTAAFADGEANAQPKEYYDGLIKSWQNTVNEVVSGKLPPEVIAGKVNFMFGQEALNVMGMMTSESRYEYFKKVASPAVTKKMLELKTAGDVDSWNTYQNWVGSSFVNLFQSAVKGMPGIGANASGVSVTWDGTTNGFKVTGDPSKGSNANIISSRPGGFINVPNPLAGVETAASTAQISASIANLNAAIRVIAPIFEANGGNTGEELFALISQMGYDPNKRAEGSFSQELNVMIGDALVMGLQAMGAPVGGEGTKFAAGEL